jgi:hypothetical protein
MSVCAREIPTVVRQPCPVYLFSQTDQSISERQVLEVMIEHARNGNLGFEIPDDWTYSYSDQLIACGSMPGGTGCVFRAEISDPNDPNRVFALTNPEKRTTEFDRGAASQGTYSTSYQNPSNTNEVVFTPPTELDAYEQAAWVLGHEVDGHINQSLPGTSTGELQSQYYGRRAVNAWRRFLEKSNRGQ